MFSLKFLIASIIISGSILVFITWLIMFSLKKTWIAKALAELLYVLPTNCHVTIIKDIITGRSSKKQTEKDFKKHFKS